MLFDFENASKGSSFFYCTSFKQQTLFQNKRVISYDSYVWKRVYLTNLAGSTYTCHAENSKNLLELIC